MSWPLLTHFLKGFLPSIFPSPHPNYVPSSSVLPSPVPGPPNELVWPATQYLYRMCVLTSPHPCFKRILLFGKCIRSCQKCISILWRPQHFKPFGEWVEIVNESWTEVLANHDSIPAFGPCIMWLKCQKCVSILWHPQHFKHCSSALLMNLSRPPTQCLYKMGVLTSPHPLFLFLAIYPLPHLTHNWWGGELFLPFLLPLWLLNAVDIQEVWRCDFCVGKFMSEIWFFLEAFGMLGY